MEQLGFAVREFDQGIELRPAGGDKGFAVRAVLATMAPDTPAAYLGDDCTDEDAFRAIRDRGLGVLVRPAPRATEAALWIEPPRELLEFLARWRDATRRLRAAS